MAKKKADKKVEEIRIGYRIAKIHTIKFGFKDIPPERVLELFGAPDALGVNINVGVQVDRDKSNITIDVSSDLMDNTDNSVLINHTGRTVFFIQGLEQTFNVEKNAFDLPDPLLVQIYGIAYTHARALLATEISPTCYHERYFLPVIDPSKLVQQINQ